MWPVVRHRPPLVAAAHHIQNGVDDLAPAVARRASAELDRRDEGLQDGPLGVAQVARVGVAGRAGCGLFRVASLSPPHPFKTVSMRRMSAKASSSPHDESASQLIDDIIRKTGDWRGKTLAHVRALIKDTGPAIVEEVKWKKPSKPEGVPVWSHAGIICVGETLKRAVRLTFPKGAQLTDPKQLFNARLDSSAVRAIDFHTGDTVDEAALRALILEAVELNRSKAKQPS